MNHFSIVLSSHRHSLAKRAGVLCARGFSLIELIVSIAIIAVITAVVLAQYGSFNSITLLNSLAYDVALSIREAQVLGISVRGDDGAFSSAYGMHFTSGDTYMLFVDRNDDGNYDSGEEVSSYTIGQNNEVVDLCANTTCDLATLDVLFLRPNPDALVYTDPSVSAISSSRVVVGSPDGNTRTVRIWPTGQIAIEQ